MPAWQRTHEEMEEAAPSIDWKAFRENLRAVS